MLGAVLMLIVYYTDVEFSFALCTVKSIGLTLFSMCDLL